MAEWIGKRLNDPGRFDPALETPLQGAAWPIAAWGTSGERFAVDVGMRPFGGAPPPLLAFLERDLNPLSYRASAGFLRRAESKKGRFSDDSSARSPDTETGCSTTTTRRTMGWERRGSRSPQIPQCGAGCNT